MLPPAVLGNYWVDYLVQILLYQRLFKLCVDLCLLNRYVYLEWIIYYDVFSGMQNSVIKVAEMVWWHKTNCIQCMSAYHNHDSMEEIYSAVTVHPPCHWWQLVSRYNVDFNHIIYCRILCERDNRVLLHYLHLMPYHPTSTSIFQNFT